MSPIDKIEAFLSDNNIYTIPDWGCDGGPTLQELNSCQILELIDIVQEYIEKCR